MINSTLTSNEGNMMTEKHILTISSCVCNSINSDSFRTKIVCIRGRVLDYIESCLDKFEYPPSVLFDLDCSEWNLKTFHAVAKKYHQKVIIVNES